MLKPTRMALALLLTLCTLSLALGQEMRKGSTPEKTQTITAGITAERVRIAAPSAVVQLRLEVYDEAGQKLFDTEQRGGNVLDWHLQGSAGERVADGTYLCVVTSKSLSGRLSQKMGFVTVMGPATKMRAAGVGELSLRQSQTVGPVEDGDEGLAVMSGTETEPATVLAHTGEEGQLTRTRGALSFRMGDFFTGTDQEQMRLTEEGNLGIGTAKPKVKLDVAGMIRAREGFAFSDGSRLNVNDKGELTLTSSNGTIAPNVVGTGTQNRLAKWTDNSGTLGDSLALDTGTALQLTAAPSGAVDTNLLYLNSTNGTTGVLAGNVPSYGAANGPFFAMRGNTYATIANQRGLFTIAAGNISSPVGDDGSVKFNTGNDFLRMVIRPSGNVGIGVSNPGSPLDVAGNINTSTQYNIGGSRAFVSSPNNTFAGYGAGPAMTTALHNAFFGALTGVNTTSDGNAFFGSDAGLFTSSGGVNSFFGFQAGFSNTFGDNNVFIGVGAGGTNTQGFDNTVIGANADVGSNDLLFATAIGAEAVVSTSNTIALGRANGSDIVDVPGKLQIDTMGAPGGQALCLNGSNRVALCNSSSLRYKAQVHRFLGGLEIVRRLRPISFTWKEDGSRDVGLGAEEVARVEPLLTFRNKQGQIEGVKYNQLSAVLINAVKEQQQQIQELQRQLVSLKSRIGKHHRPAASHRWS